MLALHLQNGKHSNSDDDNGISTSNNHTAEMSQTEEEVEKTNVTSYSNDIGRDYGVFLNFRKYLQELRASSKWDEIANRTICGLCNDKADDPWVASCMHIYCFNCLNMLMTSTAAENKEKARCLECGVEFHGAHPCDNLDAEPAGEEDLPSDCEPEQRFRKSKGRKKRAKSDDDTDWIDLEEGGLLPSSKTVAIKAQILNWLEEDPNGKIILYTQFLNM
jgi:hypothetical protein